MEICHPQVKTDTHTNTFWMYKSVTGECSRVSQKPKSGRLFSCQTISRLFDRFCLIFAMDFLRAGRVPCLSKQLHPPRTPPDWAALSSALWWREKGKRAALRRDSTTRRCQAQGAVSWMMIWIRPYCRVSLCCMLKHGPLWLGVDPLCGQGPIGGGGMY